MKWQAQGRNGLIILYSQKLVKVKENSNDSRCISIFYNMDESQRHI